MFEAMFEAFQQHAWMVLLAQIALALITLLFSRRSQIDAWAEAHPTAAAVHKLARAFSIDLWMVLQGLSLLIRKRLPDSKDPPSQPPTGERPVGQAGGQLQIMPPRMPPGSAAMVALFVLCAPLLFACSSSAPPPALPPTSTLPPEDPCRLEAITAFAESCGGDCDRAGGDVETCKAKCDREIDERCKQ